jgi:hypothetical protein
MNAPELLDSIAPEQADTRDAARRGAGTWMVVLILVVVFGYLTASRRKALGTFAEQVADILRDFRGYDPEF